MKNVGISIFLNILFYNFARGSFQSQTGPDPWNYENTLSYSESEVAPIENLPPDIKIPVNNHKCSNSKGSSGVAEWSFRRIIAILIKGSRVQKNDDGSIDIPTHMKFNYDRWEVLNKYLSMDEPLSEEAVRRVLSYIEESIYKPSIAEKTIMAWNEYIKVYLIEYKVQIMITLITMSIIGMIMWIWRHNNKSKCLIVFLLVYFYEGIISYKEAEQKEFDTFRSALESCQWKFWSQTCDVPKPDLLIFLKHMHPIKIFVRMFSGFISEPMNIIYETVDVIFLRITDGLWGPLQFPFAKFVQPLLICVIITMLVLVLCNAFILNIPSLASGITRLLTAQSTRSAAPSHRIELQRTENMEIIKPATIDRLLDVCARALDTAANHNRQNQRVFKFNTQLKSNTSIRRSASTGRLPSLNASDNNVIDASGDHL